MAVQASTRDGVRLRVFYKADIEFGASTARHGPSSACTPPDFPINH